MIAGDADPVSWLRVVFACAFVLTLLAGMAAALKLAAKRGFRLPGLAAQGARLTIVESLALDARRRLVIVKCDDAEHLLLLGVNQDTVVQSNLGKVERT